MRMISKPCIIDNNKVSMCFIKMQLLNERRGIQVAGGKPDHGLTNI